jgi:hypothetical protein
MAKSGAKVALLDKERFPRDKICGDAVCTPAIHILEVRQLGAARPLYQLLHPVAVWHQAYGSAVRTSGNIPKVQQSASLGWTAWCHQERSILIAKLKQCGTAQLGSRFIFAMRRAPLPVNLGLP